MKKLLITLILLTSIWASNIRLVTETSYHKLINSNQGIQFLVKTSINLKNDIVLKAGFSECYTGARGANPLAMNHNLLRGDIGVYWIFSNDLMFGYTHSERNLISGATNTNVFAYESVDIFSIRKEFEINF